MTVGRKPSSAGSYLGDHHEVVELLKMLASLSTTGKRAKPHASMGDLTTLESLHSQPSAAESRGARTSSYIGRAGSDTAPLRRTSGRS